MFYHLNRFYKEGGISNRFLRGGSNHLYSYMIRHLFFLEYHHNHRINKQFPIHMFYKGIYKAYIVLFLHPKKFNLPHYYSLF